MPRATTRCMNCGEEKEQGEYLADYCGACFAAKEGAKTAAIVEGKDPNAAAREALASRAHIAHRNFVDPRAIDRKTVWMMGNAPPALPPN